MKAFYHHSELTHETPKEIGGKAYNLLQINRLNFAVPNWGVIPVNNLNELVLNEFSFSETLVKDILSALSGDYFAVRSSASNEDGVGNSYAGMFDTYLYVSKNELIEKILVVVKSANSQRVQNYRKQNGIEGEFGVAVIIQEMLPSEVSGVAFGINPVTEDSREKVVSAVFGLGEGLVSGELNADEYTVRSDGQIAQRLTFKDRMLVFAPETNGVKYLHVEASIANDAALNSAQIHEVAECLNQLESYFGAPQDIEFAYQRSNFYLLQTRPITGGLKPRGEYTVWDNSNIVESYPGITTPLTYSFITEMYEAVYKQFVGLLGVSKSVIEANQHVFANTLGLVRGRVYYNLLSWYKMLAMVPGYSINAAYMETMMGVKERFELEEKYQMSKGAAWFRIVLIVFKMLWLNARLPAIRRKFMMHLDSVMAGYADLDYESMSVHELQNKYTEFEKRLLVQWKAPLINDFFSMIWFGMLQKQVSKLNLQNEPNLHNDLLCGSADIISTQPIHRSMAIAAVVLQDSEAKRLFVMEDAAEVWRKLEEGHFSTVRAMIYEYLKDFGERCIGELKLETVSYSQDPARFVAVIQAYVRQNLTEARTSKIEEKQLRERAERVVLKSLKDGRLKRWWFNKVLSKARDLVSNRENLRYERTRAFGVVRNLFAHIGHRFYDGGDLSAATDVFYLEKDELLSCSPKGLSDDLKSLIEKRKREFESYRSQKLPEERFFSYGDEFLDKYIYSKDKIEPLEGNLEGVGCSPGRVSGKVRIVLDPTETASVDGDILVTSSTDPGWVTLFPTASAIIVERGSLLSHSAIVSREMGIPCIVGVTGLLRTLKTGDKIEMDGSSGKIKRA